jgi:hypothetical protein
MEAIAAFFALLKPQIALNLYMILINYLLIQNDTLFVISKKFFFVGMEEKLSKLE